MEGLYQSQSIEGLGSSTMASGVRGEEPSVKKESGALRNCQKANGLDDNSFQLLLV